MYPASRRRRLTPTRAARAACVLAASIALTGACRGVPAALGADRREAHANADALFGALAARFDSVQRAPKFFQARAKLGKFALSPSKVFGDTSVWTSIGSDSTRTLTLSGTPTQSGYLFAPDAATSVPNTPGESRHVIQLRRRGDSQFEWNTGVDHAIGGVSANEVAAATSAWLGAAESATPGTVRYAARTLFPRTARVLGELSVLDTVNLTHLPDRSTAVSVRFHIEPERIEKARPNFAKYLEKYVQPAKYRLRLADGSGATWIDARGGDGAFAMSYRVRDGKLLAIDDPPRPMPDSLQIMLDFSAKFMIFRVGITDLVGDFVFIREPGERGWAMRFRREPDWHFPLAVTHLIRTSLRHPFEGEGIALRISVRDGTATQSLLSRRTRVAVQESAIVRWLGGLGSSAMSDFAGRAEAEENRYVFEVLSALRGDFMSAVGSGE